MKESFILVLFLCLSPLTSLSQQAECEGCMLVHAFWNEPGDRLLFHIYNPKKEGFTICSVDADGDNFKLLRESEVNDQITLLGNWVSNDRIAFWGKDANGIKAYTMDDTGDDVKSLTDKDLRRDVFNSGWVTSSSGDVIAFTSDVDGNGEIYTLNTQANTLTRITNHEANDFYPILSMDGRKIVFVSERDGNLNLYSANANGSEFAQLTTYEGHDAAPFWSADGAKITFQSDREGDIEVYQMNADGSEIERMTESEGFDGEPVYGPDGQIFYIDQGRISIVNPETKVKKEFLSIADIFQN